MQEDFQQEHEWYRKAADQDDAEQKYQFGKLLYDIDPYKYGDEGKEWIVEAAKQGHAAAQDLLDPDWYWEEDEEDDEDDDK